MNNTSQQHQPHAYKGTLLVCLTCYRPKVDALHQASVNESKLESRVMPSCLTVKQEPTDANVRGFITPIIPKHSHICPVCLEEHSHANEDDTLNCNLPHTTLCLKCKSLPEKDREYAEWSNLASVSQSLPVAHSHTCRKCDKTEIHNLANCKLPELVVCANCAGKTCPSHKCPSCQTTWKHDHCCKSVSNGLCEKCATQSTASIFRPVEIEQLAQTAGEVISGREHKEIELQNEVLVYNLCHDEVTHTLLPDWQEKIHAHRRNQKQLIERYRIGELSTMKKLRDFQNEQTSTLTLEEREAWEKAAKKKQRAAGNNTTALLSKDSKPAVTDAQKAYNTLIKDLCNQVKKKRPGLSDDEVVKAAEKRYKLMNEEDAE